MVSPSFRTIKMHELSIIALLRLLHGMNWEKIILWYNTGFNKCWISYNFFPVQLRHFYSTFYILHNYIIDIFEFGLYVIDLWWEITVIEVHNCKSCNVALGMLMFLLLEPFESQTAANRSYWSWHIPFCKQA